MPFRTRPNYRQYLKQVRVASQPALSAHERQVIDHRQQQVIRSVGVVLTDRYFQAVAEPSSVSTKGGVAYQRQLAFAKVAIFNEGRNLLLHWAAIKLELIIPWGLHYYNNSASAWKAIGSRLESTFFATKRDDFDATELALHEGRWLPVEQTDIPGYGLVERDDALEFLGIIGGVDPTIAHPARPFSVTPTQLTIQPGQVVEFRFKPTVHAEFPVLYDVADPFPSWVSISEHGLVVLTPPAAMADETFDRAVTAVDGLGTEVVFNLRIEVVN